MANQTEKTASVKVNPAIEEFLCVLCRELGKEETGAIGTEKPEEWDLSETSESMTLFYEKVRNLIEYKDDHLIKRAAIERILKRNLLIELRREDFTDQFMAELVMSGYLHREFAGPEQKEKIRGIISKYRKLARAASGYELRRWIVSIAASEIEEFLFPNPLKKALVRAMYQTVGEKIVLKRDQVVPNAGMVDIQIYIAVLKSLTKVDNVALEYVLFKLYFPDWFASDVSDKTIRETASRVALTAGKIRRSAESPLSAKIAGALKKYALFFNVFSDVTVRNFSNIQKIIKDPEALKFAVGLSAEDVYDREMRKFKKRVRRSLFFLIITKVLLAVLVEYPYEKYFLGGAAYGPIAINLLFPPVYLMFFSSLVLRPSSENSTLIAKGVESIVYETDRKPIVLPLAEEKNLSSAFLDLFFLLTFAISFGIAILILRRIDFSWFAIGVFLFLFSVVSFFNALVRQPVRDLLVRREREGILGMIIDTLSLPFVRIGKWMTVNFSRVNVFLFLFDVVIEAPFKVVVRFVQEWAGFLRRKRDELI